MEERWVAIKGTVRKFKEGKEKEKEDVTSWDPTTKMKEPL
jgi:hypothetical protein